MRMLCELLSEPNEHFHKRTFRSYSRRAGTAADFARQINQRNGNGERADDLANCTNRFPIHGMDLIMIARISIERTCAEIVNDIMAASSAIRQSKTILARIGLTSRRHFPTKSRVRASNNEITRIARLALSGLLCGCGSSGQGGQTATP